MYPIEVKIVLSSKESDVIVCEGKMKNTDIIKLLVDTCYVKEILGIMKDRLLENAKKHPHRGDHQSDLKDFLNSIKD